MFPHSCYQIYMHIKLYNKTVVLSALGFLNIIASCSSKKYSFQKSKDFLLENEADVLSNTIGLSKSDHLAVLQLLSAYLQIYMASTFIIQEKTQQRVAV